MTSTHLKINKLLAASALFVVQVSTSQAANVTEINRYTTVTNKPSTAQLNPLLAVQLMHFPHEIKTVGQAMTYWLRYSGYSLASKEKQLPSVISVMDLPLPQVHRSLGPLTVLDGLEVLAGQPLFSLVNDSFKREVNFKLRQTISGRKKS